MNRDQFAHMSLILGWAFTSITPSLCLQLLSGAGTILAGVNYWLSIIEKRANIKKLKDSKKNEQQGNQ